MNYDHCLRSAQESKNLSPTLTNALFSSCLLSKAKARCCSRIIAEIKSATTTPELLNVAIIWDHIVNSTGQRSQIPVQNLSGIVKDNLLYRGQAKI